MSLFTLDEVDAASAVVRIFVPPTPAYPWPLLARRTGAEVVVKHENHTPIGSFKARGALTYVDALGRADRMPKGLVTATRGNHGQSVAIAAAHNGIPAVIVVPEGNSAEKNAAMAALGGQLVTAGKDFDESRTIAVEIQHARGYHFVPSFHRELVRGVATYARELFASRPDLDVVFAPIGIGTGICGLITVRDLLGLKTEIVGVVAENAPALLCLWRPVGLSRPKRHAPSRTDLPAAIRRTRHSRLKKMGLLEGSVGGFEGLRHRKAA